MDWIYLASPKRTDLPSTLQAVLQHLLLCRPAHTREGKLIPNVRHLQIGDSIMLAWRKDGYSYLRCQIGDPADPVADDLVIDRISAGEAGELEALGYAVNSEGFIEAIRLEAVEECYFHLSGEYGGHNALHSAADVDVDAISTASPIPAGAMVKAAGKVRAPRLAAKSLPTPQVACPVDQVSVQGGGAPRAFDAYIMVDWSSSGKPVTGNDSIWVAAGCWRDDSFTAGAPANLATRHQAVQAIEKLARDWKKGGKRVLVGMDFAFGYPSGFAKALDLDTSRGAWRAVHEYVAREVSDDEKNRNNRDAFADACNQRIEPSGPGPFWGCTQRASTEFLTQQRAGIFQFPYAGCIAEWRATDMRAQQRTVTQSVWKLNCGVSVGGQTIVGIKHLHALAEALDARRWPFDTRWVTPAPGSGCVWFAEIFPSLVRYEEWDAEHSLRRDRTQVQSCVRRAAEEDAQGALAEQFKPPQGLSEAELQRVEDEEGWILWV